MIREYGQGPLPIPELHLRIADPYSAGRDNRVPSYPSFSLDTLRSLPIPDFTALGENELSLLIGWFDWLQNEPLQPFPNIHEDPVRHQIDDAVVQALGFDGDWVATIRRELAREPSIKGRR